MQPSRRKEVLATRPEASTAHVGTNDVGRSDSSGFGSEPVEDPALPSEQLQDEVSTDRARRSSSGQLGPLAQEASMQGKHDPAPPGYRWVYCLSFVHWRSGKRVFRKDGGYFRFLARKR